MAGVVLLAGGGGGGYWWWSHRAPAGAQAEAPPPAEPGIVSFEPFVANLADAGGGRFLRASLKLVVEGAERAKEVEENAVERAQLQSAILEVLTQQTADALVTPEGKTALKEAILARTGEVLHETPITDVLITEFVVQF
ncbi:MAG TPA: flagellar basal body-associated FliL family protein [Vicinamibacterales bacterium]